MAENVTETKETTTSITGGSGSDSQIFGVSVRGWMAAICITTVCICSVLKVDINELLGYLATSITAFYFGQARKT